MIDRPSSTLSGVATKKIWNCGITRPMKPAAMLNTSEKTSTGAASWMPSAKVWAMVLDGQLGEVADPDRPADREQGEGLHDRGDEHLVQVGGEDQASGRAGVRKVARVAVGWACSGLAVWANDRVVCSEIASPATARAPRNSCSSEPMRQADDQLRISCPTSDPHRVSGPAACRPRTIG